MQKSIFFFCLLMLSFGACQNEGSTTPEGTDVGAVNTDKTSATDQTGEQDLNKQPFAKPDTPQMERVKRVFTTNYWVNTAYFKMSEKGSNKKNQGNWY
ncbi:MAG: hypothetical protein ACI9JY_003280, partial [Saprospiraceae bacterium]